MFSGIYGLFGKWLLSGQLKIDLGEISLLKQRACMLPVSFFVEMQKDIEKSKNKHIKDDLYLWAWKTAYLYIKRFIETYKLNTFEERYKLGMDVASVAGFGDYKTISYQSGKYEYSYFYVINNPIAKALYPSKKPVDIFLRGINAGGGTACHMKIVDSIELECQAVNGKRCVFLTGDEKSIRKFNAEKIYHDQIDIDYVRPIQKEFIKKHGLPKVKR